MIEAIVSIWLVGMGTIVAGIIVYAVLTFPLRLLAHLGADGWSDKEPIIIFSRKTWSWLLPSAKVK
jgi:hypothetical protein